MPKLIILGSSNAIPEPSHENTHMVLEGKERTVLIDCVDSTLLRLEQAGVDFRKVTDLVLTHFHPDHVSGVPQFLMNMWLMDRKEPLMIHGLSFTLQRIKKVMGFYSWTEWPHFFPVKFSRVPARELTRIITGPEFDVITSPVRHFIPTIGIKISFHGSGKSVVYSCDTEPCTQLQRLAQGADVLIHEASGDLPGHSSAQQAGRMARRSGASTLFLIHYPTGKFASGDPVAEAKSEYDGQVALATDFLAFDY